MKNKKNKILLAAFSIAPLLSLAPLLGQYNTVKSETVEMFRWGNWAQDNGYIRFNLDSLLDENKMPKYYPYEVQHEFYGHNILSSPNAIVRRYQWNLLDGINKVFLGHIKDSYINNATGHLSTGIRLQYGIGNTYWYETVTSEHPSITNALFKKVEHETSLTNLGAIDTSTITRDDFVAEATYSPERYTRIESLPDTTNVKHLVNGEYVAMGKNVVEWKVEKFGDDQVFIKMKPKYYFIGQDRRLETNVNETWFQIVFSGFKSTDLPLTPLEPSKPIIPPIVDPIPPPIVDPIPPPVVDPIPPPVVDPIPPPVVDPIPPIINEAGTWGFAEQSILATSLGLGVPFMIVAIAIIVIFSNRIKRERDLEKEKIQLIRKGLNNPSFTRMGKKLPPLEISKPKTNQAMNIKKV